MTHFFSCDWGTSSFRLRRVSALTGEILGERRDATGVRSLFSLCQPHDKPGREKVFADFLCEQLLLITANDTAALDGASVIISGMASSSVGWRELPYATAPVALDGSGVALETLKLSVGHGAVALVRLISGVRVEDDIMRGEETEILGLFAGGNYANIAESGIVVLPGTHSKHVLLKGRQLVDFRTYMTGELFDVLAAHSLLRASVLTPEGATPGGISDPPSREAFMAGARQSRSRGLAGALFQTRVRTVLHSAQPAVNRWFLSGLLIGSEAVELQARDSGLPLLLAAAEPLSAAYRLAFETLGMSSRLSVAPPAEMATASVRGHRALLDTFGLTL